MTYGYCETGNSENCYSSKKKSQSFRKHEQATAFWFIFPAIALLLVFVFYPMLQAFIISFKNYSLVGAGDVFVGMDNYVHLMKDRAFFNSLKHSFYFAIDRDSDSNEHRTWACLIDSEENRDSRAVPNALFYPGYYFDSGGGNGF